MGHDNGDYVEWPADQQLPMGKVVVHLSSEPY